MTDRNGLTESPAEPRALLGLLYGVIEEAERYEGCLQGTERLHDRELADFLGELRDGTRRRADRAETLLAQRLAIGGRPRRGRGVCSGLRWRCSVRCVQVQCKSARSCAPFL